MISDDSSSLSHTQMHAGIIQESIADCRVAAIKGFDANQSSLSCQFGTMAEIYNRGKGCIADAQCLVLVIALHLIHWVAGGWKQPQARGEDLHTGYM